MKPPPCVTPGEPLNFCARSVYALEITSHYDLSGPWAGWKLRGTTLVSPDKDRVTVERLRGLLFVESLKPKASPGDGTEQNLGVRLIDAEASGSPPRPATPLPARR